jgi:hypothetical protein
MRLAAVGASTTASGEVFLFHRSRFVVLGRQRVSLESSGTRHLIPEDTYGTRRPVSSRRRLLREASALFRPDVMS